MSFGGFTLGEFLTLAAVVVSAISQYVTFANNVQDLKERVTRIETFLIEHDKR